MASQAASGRTPTGSPAVAVVVGEEELLVERAVARLVAAASAATGPAGAGEGPFPAGSGVHEVSGGALGHGDLATLTAPSLFGGGCVVVIRDAHNAGKDATDELTRMAAGPPPDVRLVVTHAGGAKGKALLASLTGSGARVIECPNVLTMRHPPNIVPSAIAAWQERITHSATVCSCQSILCLATAQSG